MNKDGSITIDIGPAHRGLVDVLRDCAASSMRLKPVGRRARRAAFYDRNRRKAQGRSVIRQLCAALPAKAEQQAVGSLSTVYRDEWEAPTFDGFRPGAHN